MRQFHLALLVGVGLLSAAPVNPMSAAMPPDGSFDLEWAVYAGGWRYDYGRGVAVDSSQNIALCGDTESLNIERPLNSYHGGEWEGFLTRIDVHGTVLWGLYLGGTHRDWTNDVEVDAAGNAYVVGLTQSSDFVGANNSYGGGNDAYLAKIEPNGHLAWMTYLGGTGQELAYKVAVNEAGTSFVVGPTSSANFPGHTNEHHGGTNDVFVAAVDTDGNRLWMTYYGGSEEDHGASITIAPNGDLIIAGNSDSEDFEGRGNSNPGGIRGFAARLTQRGDIVWMRYFGGSNGRTWGTDISSDSRGNLWLTGVTFATDFEGRLNSHHSTNGEDAFIAKLSSDGEVIWMRYLGGTGRELGAVVASLPNGGSLVSGTTRSDDFEGRVNSRLGADDIYVVEVDDHGGLVAMRYAGGPGADGCTEMILGPDGAAILGASTSSTDLPGRRNDYRDGGSDACVIKHYPYGKIRLEVDARCPRGGPFEVRWQYAMPRGVVAIFSAPGFGFTSLPGGHPCEGVLLGIGAGSARFVGDKGSRLDGSGRIRGIAQPSACGMLLQLVDLGACQTSNVVRIQ